MNGKEKKTPARQFHSLDGLDTIGDLMSESKTVTAVVSKGMSRDLGVVINVNKRGI